jgi:hypothetical protein
MKRAILLSMMSVILLVSKSDAQHFSFVTSTGHQHNWGIPQAVYQTIDYDFHGYQWVHASQVLRHGYTFYDVTLVRGNTFVQLEMGHHGEIFSQSYTRSFPFDNHVCGHQCGFHDNFYTNNVAICGGPVIIQHRKQYVRPTSVVYVQSNKHYGYGHGNKSNGKGKHSGNGNSSTYGNKYDNDRRGQNSRVTVDSNRSRTGTATSSGNRIAETTEPTYRSRPNTPN